MMRIPGPTRLPAARDLLLDNLDKDRAIWDRWRDHLTTAWWKGMAALARSLVDPSLELFWISEETTRLAAAAATEDVDKIVLTPESLPAPTGLLYWGIPLEHGDLTACGFVWRSEGDEVACGLLVDPSVRAGFVPAWAEADGLADHCTPASIKAAVDRLHWLDPVEFWLLRLGQRLDDGPTDLNHDEVAGTQDLRVLLATWLLATQPGVAEEALVNVVEPGFRGSKRKRRSAPTVRVRVVNLRGTTVTARRDVEAADRDYRHRWIVRGHWRQQACGPGKASTGPSTSRRT